MPFDGVNEGMLYIAGAPANGDVGDDYYESGYLFTGTRPFNSLFYVNGNIYTGVYSGTYYASGIPSTGTVDGVYYVNGSLANDLYDGVYYVDGIAQ